jgi:uncharacterized protein (DUF433 family)
MKQIMYFTREHTMSGLVMDFQSVAGRLGVLENELHQLRDLVSSQLVSAAPADHPYVTWMEDILSGEPIIKGTRTPVRAVVEYWKFGDAPEEIVRRLPHLRLAQVFDALSYYDDHRAEIERTIALNRVPVDG